jgi:hypothetical protein
MVTPIVPITTTPASENTPALHTILMVSVWTMAPQPEMGLPPFNNMPIRRSSKPGAPLDRLTLTYGRLNVMMSSSVN